MSKVQQVKTKVAEATHEPDRDEYGVLRTSRTYTPEEAAAIDAANREARMQARRNRFQRGSRAK